MKPRVTIITLGVDDLQKALAFYRDGLGWTTPGIIGAEFEHGAVVFFDLPSGMQLALWPRDSIAHDAGLVKGPRSSTEFTLAHNVNSVEAVDSAMALARQAGAQIIKEAGKTFYGGYAGYFADPDGHVWEIAWNPQIQVSDDVT
jgi:catechol 2,3-dioxygenase-like lactoylglutathione lyase family enzyme